MSKLNGFFIVSLTACSLFMLGCGSETEPKTTAVQAEAHQAGEALYKQNCKVCHAQGLNGAPIVGNKKMWGPRAEQGAAVLVQHAVNGFGLMPAKGGKSHLTEEEITAVVEYMLAQIQ